MSDQFSYTSGSPIRQDRLQIRVFDPFWGPRGSRGLRSSQFWLARRAEQGLETAALTGQTAWMRRTAGGSNPQGQLAAALIASIPGTILILNPMGRILFLSTTDDDVLGQNPDFWLGQSALDMIHPDDLPLVTPRINKAISGDPSPRQVIHLRVGTDDTSWFPVEAYGFHPIDFEGGRGVVVSIRDTSRAIMFKRAQQFARRTLKRTPGDRVSPVDEISDRRSLIEDLIPSMFMHGGQSDQLMILNLRFTNFKERASEFGAEATCRAVREVASSIGATSRPDDLIVRSERAQLVLALTGVTTQLTVFAIAERVYELSIKQQGDIAFTTEVGCALISQADDYDDVLDYLTQATHFPKA